MASIICAQCKKRLDNDYIYYEKTAKKLCSMECMSLFLQSEKEKEDRYKLEKTICRVFNVSEISTRIRKDIKNLTEKEGLAYSQISAILHYIYDIEGKNITKLPDDSNVVKGVKAALEKIEIL